MLASLVDPRCRSWFHTGKTLYEANKQPVFITALHESALENSAFNSSATATSPVVNPVTEVYVGQTLINFIPSAVRSMLDPLTDYISFVIAPETNQSSGNTVVGPDKSSGWISAPIADLLFPHDPLNSSRQIFFEMWILPSLNNGTSNYSEFSRINKHGDEEVFTLAFEPVYARVLLPLDPSNFSRGVNTSRILVYSVGIAAAKVAIEEPWQTIEADVNNDLRRLNALYITIVCFVSLCLMLFSYKVS